MNRFIKRSIALTNQPDFKSNPVKAIWRRLWWRIRWKLKPNNYFVLPFYKDLKIALMKNTGALIYYYRGPSDSISTSFFLSFLKFGMCVVDVGAHIGEYTILAAFRLANTGQVHAFEPNPEVIELLRYNISLNGFQNVKVNQAAVSNTNSSVPFIVRKDSSVSSLKTDCSLLNNRDQIIKVPSLTLDSYFSEISTKVDLLKIDVEGGELFVFQKATKLLRGPSREVPVIIFEYSQKNTNHFGYNASVLLEFLRDYGYVISYLSLENNGQIKLNPISSNEKIMLMSTNNLIATKDMSWLLSELQPY